MWIGNHIGHHTVIEDNVMITFQVIISGACSIAPYSFFAVNATVRDETVIGRETIVGAGTTIMADTRPFSVYKVRVVRGGQWQTAISRPVSSASFCSSTLHSRTRCRLSRRSPR